MSGRRLRVDPVACDAFGHCAELVPELVGLDEWGYPVVEDRACRPHEVGSAELAVKSCPRRALFMEAVAEPDSPPSRRAGGLRPPGSTATGGLRRVTQRR